MVQGSLVQVGVVVASVVGLWIGARWLVDAVGRLARRVGLSELTVVAVGTSTPELAVSLVALRRGSLGVSVGNVGGSNAFNATGIVRAGALVGPLSVSPSAFATLAWLAEVSVAMVAALWTGRVLSRLKGTMFADSEVVR